jgi:MFS family permease
MDGQRLRPQLRRFPADAAVLGDRFGRRRLFAAGLVLFVAASAACALASSIGWLIAARALQGVGAAIVVPLALAQISAAFPPERRGWALGIYSSVAGLSTVLGPIVGGVLTEGVAWRWIFWVNLPIALATAALAVARLRETFGVKETIDLPGLVLATAGAFGLVWGLVRANAAGGASLEIVCSLAGGALMIALLVAWELWAAQPMIPMRFFRLRAFSAGNIAMFCLTGALMSAIFFMAQFQQAALGADSLSAGLRLLPWGIAVVVGARIVVPFAERSRRGRFRSHRPGCGPGLARSHRRPGHGLRRNDPADDLGRCRLRGGSHHCAEGSRRCGSEARHRQSVGHAQHDPPARRRLWGGA